MASQWQLDSLNGRTETLRAEVRRVADKHHRDAIARRLYKAIEEAVKERTKRLKLKRQRAQTKEDLSIAFETIQEQLAALIHLFNKCDRLDSARIPFEILDSLAVAATSLLGEKCEVVVQLSPAYNYEIVSMRRLFEQEAWSKHWLAAQGSGDATTALLMVFPSYEISSVLLHAASAHELAHELALKNLETFTKAVDGARSAIVKRDSQLRHYADEPPGHVEKGDKPEDAFELQLFRWTQEIFADLVGVRLVGPPFLLALERMSVARNTVMKLETHPPLYLRRRLIKEYLRNHLPHIADDEVWKPKLAEEPESRHLAGAWHTKLGLTCEEAAKAFAPIVNDIASPLTDPNLDKEVAQIRTHIENLIPPSAAVAHIPGDEVAKRFWLLIYGAWRFVTEDKTYGDFCDQYGWKDDPGRAEKAINSLLLHSLQAIELRARIHDAFAMQESEKESRRAT